MKFLTTTASRVLFALPFGIFGVMHFPSASILRVFVPGFLPFKTMWVYFVGLCFILACISIITKKHAKLACLLLSALLFILIITVHLPHLATPNAAYAVNAFLKDTALMAGALTLAGIFANEENNG